MSTTLIIIAVIVFLILCFVLPPLNGLGVTIVMMSIGIFVVFPVYAISDFFQKDNLRSFAYRWRIPLFLVALLAGATAYVTIGSIAVVTVIAIVITMLVIFLFLHYIYDPVYEVVRLQWRKDPDKVLNIIGIIFIPLLTIGALQLLILIQEAKPPH